MNDQLIVKLSKDLVLTAKDGSSLVLDTGKNGGETIDFAVPIKPQIEEKSAS